MIALSALGAWMTTLDYYHSWQPRALAWHRALGMIALLLFFFKVIWRVLGHYPPLSSKLQPWQARAAAGVHLALFALLFIVPFSGYLISTAAGDAISVFGWFDVPPLFVNKSWRMAYEAVHWWAAYALCALAAIHAGAAIKHHLINKDDTLKRML